MFSGSLADPVPVPARYTVQWHEQRVDHFNAQVNATFSQKYLVNNSWWGGPPAPILFYTGGEGSGVDAIFLHWGPVLALGRCLHALIVFAEMRFFGESMPYGEDGSFKHDATHLGALSIEQTLADYPALLGAIRTERRSEASPAIAVGGSLAGSRASFLRLKYPSVVDMGLAASVPILGYPSLTDPFGDNP